MKSLNETLRKINTLLKVIKEQITIKQFEIENITYLPCGYKIKDTYPDLSTFVTFDKSMTWGKSKDSHAWFHFNLKMPEYIGKNEFLLKIRTEKEDWDACNPQFIAYIDGKIKQGLDTNHTTITLYGKDEYDVLLYAYSGPQNTELKLFCDVIFENQAIKKFYYDCLVPYQSLEYLNENSFEYQTVLSSLDSALTKVDFLSIGTPEFEKSVTNADKYLENEFYKKYSHKKDVTVMAIGHTHIDIAWLWTLEQTREKAQRSFSTVIELMKRYPEYKFMSSQAVLYKMVKEECPELYEEIKKMIKDGRWEVEGAMWVEADCNLSSGESLVRQVQYGKNFFRNEFGVESHILWLPDVFGYSAALPQILRKSDVDWFVTSKISWNDTNMMPYDTFKWKGIDGTKINSYFLTAQTAKRDGSIENGTIYCPTAAPGFIKGTYNRYQQKALSNEAIITFGFGDGGGGPTDEMLEMLRRQEKGTIGCEQTKIDFAGNFLDRLKGKMEKNPSNVPLWQGELYLEFHRGTYTSQANNKKNNRKCEFLVLDTEFLYSMLEKMGLASFPKEKLKNVWETILVNQFHDIIPGSSIPEVYERSDSDYKQITELLNSLRDYAFEEIAKRVGDSGYVVINPHSFACSGVVRIDGKSVYVKNIPPKGYKVVHPEEPKNTIKVSGKTVYTKYFTVKFDKNMNITSIYDKKNHREVIRPKECGNQFIILEDYNDCYDAWEHQIGSRDKICKINSVYDVNTVDDGDRCGISYKRKHMNTEICQTVWFYEDMPKIDFETKVDWHEKHQALKVLFPVDINSDKATYEIQFGTIERPTHFNTSWDRAKFEVCGHKYADLSDGGYGVSLMNDCKYGHDIHNGEMRLTLLRAGANPDNVPEHINDQGVHTFTYSLYPHKGNFASADTFKFAYELNLPMSVKKAHGNGTLPNEYSFVTTSAENVVIETIKKAEYSDETVIRMYETKNVRTKTTITFGFDVSDVYLANLSEKKEKQLKVNNNSVVLDIKPFEIVTLIIK